MQTVKLDYLTENGAKALAARIERHWKACGYLGIKARIGRIAFDDLRDPIFVVRSNIGAYGFPPRAAEKVAA